MATTDVKLLGLWASPYVVRAKLALSIKEVEYQEEVLHSDEVFEGSSILPSDPPEHAEARFWAYYIEDKVLASFISIVVTNVTQDDKLQTAEKIISEFKPLEEYLAEKPFFGGDSIGYVDIALGASMCWVKVTQEVESVKVLDEAKLPNLVKSAERFSSDDTVKGVVPEHNKQVEYCKVIQEKVRIYWPAN